MVLGPAVNPTIVIVGLNRSGTTALSQCFLNHPYVEVFKDPGKYLLESTNVSDFSHFFVERRFESTQARVVKVSVGQYTTELCTIPIYPMMQERPDFLRKLHHIFLIRDPIDLWSSWEAMTRWIRSTEDPAVRESWRTLQRDKGIVAGWGSVGLFDLAYRYFYQTFLYIKTIAPLTTYALNFRDLQLRNSAAAILQQICENIGIEFLPAMVDWRIRFGDSTERLVDGFRRPLDHPERQYIHRSILASDGMGLDSSRQRDGTEKVRPHSITSVSEDIVLGGLAPLYDEMLEHCVTTPTSRI